MPKIDKALAPLTPAGVAPPDEGPPGTMPTPMPIPILIPIKDAEFVYSDTLPINDPKELDIEVCNSFWLIDVEDAEVRFKDVADDSDDWFCTLVDVS